MIYFSERSFTSFHSVQDDRVGEVRMTPPPFRHSERSEESRSFIAFSLPAQAGMMEEKWRG